MTSEDAIWFEGVKVSMNQTKDGFMLRVSIHPNDVPTALVQDWVGTRYMVAMSRIGDDDQPEASDYTIRCNRAIQSAGMLCRNEAFHTFLVESGYAPEEVGDIPPETVCADALRALLGVKSRSDMRTNKEALEAFETLRDDFAAWRQYNTHRTER